MTAPAYLTYDAKLELCQVRVTLNGKPAGITGALNDFGTIYDFDGRSFDWAWPTIASIVARGGDFRS